MSTILLIGLALVASASAFVEVGLGYHQEVGIPTAEKIRVAEEKILVEEAQNRVVGGSVAPNNALPYFGGLLISLDGLTSEYSVCGSSLLSANRLVTAAHCWNDGHNQAWQFLVVLGSKQLFSGGIRITTTDVVMHPQYNTTNYRNDIAIIRLPHKVKINRNIEPIFLPTFADLYYNFAGERAFVAGYGRTSDQQSGASTVVSQVDVQVIDNHDCESIYSPEFVSPTTICTSNGGGVGACIEGSGGPLVFSRAALPTLIGVVSYVSAAGCQVGLPTAYARVSTYNDFIVQQLDAVDREQYIQVID